jgi:hypothetical protein
MAAMLLPGGYTLEQPQPNPSAAKAFRDRIGVYWILPGDDRGRTQIEWGIAKNTSSLDEEVEHINARAPGEMFRLGLGLISARARRADGSFYAIDATIAALSLGGSTIA